MLRKCYQDFFAPFDTHKINVYPWSWEKRIVWSKVNLHIDTEVSSHDDMHSSHIIICFSIFSHLEVPKNDRQIFL